MASTEVSGQANSNPNPSGTENPAAAEEEEEQEFEFRLFSSASTSQKTQGSASNGTNAGETGDVTVSGTQKLRIRVRSPTPGPVTVGEGRFLVPFRGWDYYFTTPELLGGYRQEDVSRAEERAAAKRAEFENIAVSQTQLLEWAKRPWVCVLFCATLSHARNSI